MTGPAAAILAAARLIGRGVGAAALPAAALGFGLGFPAFVAVHPQSFGPARLASPIGGGDPRAWPGEGRFGALAPLLVRAFPPERGPGIDPMITGAVSRDAPRVRAVAGGLVLVLHGGGAHVFAPGDRLPGGARLTRVHADGRVETDPPFARGPSASPGQVR